MYLLSGLPGPSPKDTYLLSHEDEAYEFTGPATLTNLEIEVTPWWTGGNCNCFLHCCYPVTPTRAIIDETTKQGFIHGSL